MESTINKLLKEMTIEEKAGQLSIGFNNAFIDESTVDIDEARSGKIGLLPHFNDIDLQNEIQRAAIEETRLGIPILFCQDVIHGYKTAFPIPWGEAMSWEPELAEETAAATAREAAYGGVKLTFAPMVDIARNAFWGRICEGAGEDTYLGSAFAYSRVKGFQGDDVSNPEKIAACAKHFAAYGFVEGGKDYSNADISEATLYNYILPPFRACINAGVKSVMAAFNDINGEPCTSSKWLLTDVLRNEMKFDGVVISDAFSAHSLIDHGTARNDSEAARKTLEAGLNIEMASDCFRKSVKKLIEDGTLKEEILDKAVYEVLKLKYELGLFENPYADKKKLKDVILCKEHLDIAQKSAERSIVLLENNGVLPLKKNEKIALIGPMANDKYEMTGEWSVKCSDEACVTIFEALKARCGLKYEKGCSFKKDEIWLEETAKAVSDCDVVIFAAGQTKDMCGEARSRTEIVLPGEQERLLEYLKSLGKKIVTIVISGRPIVLTDVQKNSDAVLFSGALGSRAGEAYCRVLFGEYNPSAKLVTSFPAVCGQAGTIHYNALRSCRPASEENEWSSKFIDAPIEPLYEFGYGKSYTNFEYLKVCTDKKDYKVDETIDICVDVKNTGDFDGEEIVQIYVSYPFAENVRPVKELKAFDKQNIRKGETKKFEFSVPVETLGYYNRKLDYIVDEGEVILMAGTSSKSYIECNVTIRNGGVQN